MNRHGLDIGEESGLEERREMGGKGREGKGSMVVGK